MQTEKQKNIILYMKRLFIGFIVLVLSSGVAFSQKKDTYKVRTVVIDPGHGGAKPGAQGSRSWEKNITLDVAKKFGQLITDNYPDVKVIFTRTTDADISLAQRAHIANSKNADLFISIHANSHPTASPTGVETFVMGLSESKANLEVARKENADILLEADYKNNKDYSGFDPNAPETYVMLAMFQNAFIDKSLNLAQAIQTQYKQNLKTINRGVKQAELYVLYKTTCPSVLTEIGFISNPTEEAFMLSDEGQAKIAICLFNAFMAYKAAEEGTNKIANPVIRIKGYKDPKQPTPAPKEEAKPEPAPQQEVAEAKPAPEPAPQQATVKPEPQPEADPEPAKVEEPAQLAPITVVQPNPADKPTPTAALPPQREPEPVAQAVAIPEQQPVAAGQPAPTNPKEEQPAPAKPKEEKPALHQPENTANASDQHYYTVQFLITPSLLTAGAPELEGISDFRVVQQENNYAYSTGCFKTMAEAATYCSHLKKATSFKDAWCYHYKASKAEAAAQNKQVAAAKPAAVSGLTYRVQFCTASRQFKAGDPELQGIADIHYAQSGRFFIYSAGDYTTLRDAEQRCKTIQKTTKFKDAFVIAIYKGERISLEQAAALKK